MITLFDKLDRIQVNNLCLLTPQDRVYCDTVQKEYLSHLHFFTDSMERYEQDLRRYTTEEGAFTAAFANSKDDANSLSAEWKSNIRRLEKTFIKAIESYFKKNYQLDFAGWSHPDDDDDEGDITSNQLTKL